MTALVKHDGTSKTTLTVADGELIISTKTKQITFDISSIWDLLRDNMSINDPNPSIARRAKILSQYYPNVLPPGPFTDFTKLKTYIEE